MTARLTDEGIVWRSGIPRRERLLRWDDVVRVDDGEVVGRCGERVRLSRDAATSARAALAMPDAPASLEAKLAGPFAASATAAALIAAAHARGASDLHLAPDGTGAWISLRIDGELRPFLRAGTRPAERLVAAWKGLSGCLPYRRDVIQEGRISRPEAAPRGTPALVAADVRASFVPTAFGERVALRLFGRLRRLSELGLAPADRQTLESALGERSGLLLVSGSSGAGKTTTLYAALAHISATRTGAHLSLEDPVEQRLRAAGVSVDQVELDPASGRTGEAMLAAALRQDVDVIALGEIRTPAEALLAVHAAHTGRLVLAGVHAGSPLEARQRLLDLGAAPALVESTLVCATHQDLVTDACGCAEPAACAECRGSGRRRRAVLRFLDRRKEMAA